MKYIKSLSLLFSGLFFNQSQAKIFHPSAELYSQIGGPRAKEAQLISTAQIGALFRIAFGGDNFNIGPDWFLGYSKGVASSFGLSAQMLYFEHYLFRLRFYSAGSIYGSGYSKFVGRNPADPKFDFKYDLVLGTGVQVGYLFKQNLYVMLGLNFNFFHLDYRVKDDLPDFLSVESGKKSFSFSISLGYLR